MDYRTTSIYPGSPGYGALQQPVSLPPTDYQEESHEAVTNMIDRQRPPLKSAMIKKATSTPNVRTLVNHDTAHMSAADKKRNKLGYHRTAVACGHCRRRKIRCIPSNDTTTTRCQNCIRLKKDCQFYPVDQSTQTTTKRSRSDAKGDTLNTESETSVSSSSPGLQTGAIDNYDTYRQQITSPPLSQGSTTYPPLAASSTIGGPQAPEYDYSPSYQNAGWHQAGTVNQSQRYFGDARSQAEVHGRDYWPEHGQANPDSFVPSSFPVSSGGSTVAVTSPENPYGTYPPSTQGYHYPSQTPREVGVSASGSMHPFNMYRASTMPDLGQAMGTRNAHQAAMNMSPQPMMSPQFTTPRQQNQFQQSPAMAPRWGEQSHVQPTYVSHAGGQNWYGTPAGLTNVREDQDSHGQVLNSQQVAPGQFRPNPG